MNEVLKKSIRIVASETGIPKSELARMDFAGVTNITAQIPKNIFLLILCQKMG